MRWKWERVGVRWRIGAVKALWVGGLRQMSVEGGR